MRSPSPQLSELLVAHRLCTEADLRDAEPAVRQLCQDLPDFDSVWLDALVQRGVLTPWQSDRISEDQLHAVVIDRYHCRQQLGTRTYLAIDTADRRDAILHRVRSVSSAAAEIVDRRLDDMMAAVKNSAAAAPDRITMPQEVIRQSDDRYVVFPWIPGWSLEELLIRGGRLPAEVVAEIGREILSLLAWLESVRLLHGDLVIRNVRLDLRGRVYLTTPFIRRITQPQFGFSPELTLRDCEGVAPEQVGTGRLPDARSELYALGCLLWQLLTSRPVVLNADPAGRLMQQREQDIPDVRGPVPDCPEWMCRLLLSLTRRSPELRPASAAEVLRQWKQHSGSRFTNCRRLVRSMPDHEQIRRRHIQSERRSIRSGMWPVAATAAMILLVFLVSQAGYLPSPLRVGGQPGERPSGNHEQGPVSQTDAGASPANPPSDDIRRLPEPDRDGVIRLIAGRTYLSESYTTPGPLRILNEQSPVATVLVPKEKAWRLAAGSLELRGIAVQQAAASETTFASAENSASGQLLDAQCASLLVTDCVIQSPAQSDDFTGISWQRMADDPGAVRMRNTVFSGGGYGLSLGHPARLCDLDNVLLANRGGGILCEFRDGNTDVFNLVCRNVTQRFGFSLLDSIVSSDRLRRVGLNILSAECVYAPRMAIVRLQIPESWRPDQVRVQLQSGDSGHPAVVPPSSETVVYIDPRLRRPVRLPDAQITDTSILLADLIFDEASESGSTRPDGAASEWAASALQDFEGPKLTSVMPGVDVHRLPRRNQVSKPNPR